MFFLGAAPADGQGAKKESSRSTHAIRSAIWSVSGSSRFRLRVIRGAEADAASLRYSHRCGNSATVDIRGRVANCAIDSHGVGLSHLGTELSDMTGAHTQNRRAGAAFDPSHSRSADRAALADESAELSIPRRWRRLNSRRATPGVVPVHLLSHVRAVCDE
jgi:hypothetical protein